MEDEKLWHYIGKGEYLDGIPARDLTAADWARLTEDDRAAVERSRLYRRAPRPKVEEPEPEAVAPQTVEPQTVEPQTVEPQTGEETLPQGTTPRGAKGAKENKE